MDGVQRQLAPTLQNPAVLYYAWDHLGTIRLITNDDVSLVERHDYEPYGLELPPYVNQSANTHQFTGHERDLTSGFDYMHFRYFGSTMGRFCKPDNINGKLANPQSWNKYSYVVGNPVNFNDPTGHRWSMGHLEGVSQGPTLDEYLWGEENVTQTVTHYTATDQNGNVVAFGAAGSVAPSTPAGQVVDWLMAHGIPKEKAIAVATVLKDTQLKVLGGPEKIVGIGRNKNGGLTVIPRNSLQKGPNGAPTPEDFIELLKSASKQGVGLFAMGHAHFPTGSHNPLAGGTTAEGPSIADALGYTALIKTFAEYGQTLDPRNLFVLTTGGLYAFEKADGYNFLRYSW